MRLLDLFCCAGGAAMGYARAGFEVTGVDIRPQPHYPFDFVQADALTYLADHGHEFDAVHASPPCQGYTELNHVAGSGSLFDPYPRLIEPVRALLHSIGVPFVIENVTGAREHLVDPVQLCGSSFGLGVLCRDGQYRQLQRHRLFEASFPLPGPPCRHEGQPVGLYGVGGGGQQTRGYKAHLEERGPALGIDWPMTPHELREAIPPAYTRHVGSYLEVALGTLDWDRPAPGDLLENWAATWADD